MRTLFTLLCCLFLPLVLLAQEAPLAAEDYRVGGTYDAQNQLVALFKMKAPRICLYTHLESDDNGSFFLVDSAVVPAATNPECRNIHATGVAAAVGRDEFKQEVYQEEMMSFLADRPDLGLAMIVFDVAPTGDPEAPFTPSVFCVVRVKKAPADMGPRS